MASENKDPTGDTGTGADITDIGSRRIRTERDLVVDLAEAEMEITAEAAVNEGAMVQTPTPPPPTKTVRKVGAADRTDANVDTILNIARSSLFVVSLNSCAKFDLIRLWLPRVLYKTQTL